MNRTQNKQQPQEGYVVSSQSKLEQAKYVHTENNLRKTLLNIGESFRRTNKRLSEETKTLRGELNKLRQNVEKIRQEKERRMTGGFANSHRPHRAERLLYDEKMVKLEPFNDCQKFVYQRSEKAKKQNLTPLRLHGNKTSISEKESSDINNKEEHSYWKRSRILPAIQTEENESSEEPTVGRHGRKEVTLVNVSYSEVSMAKSARSSRYLNNQKQNTGSIMSKTSKCVLGNIGASEEKSCSLKKIPCQQHFLPPLEKIPELLEPKAGSSEDLTDYL